VTKIYAEKDGKEKVAAMKAEVDQKKRDLFLGFPYIHLRSSFRGFQTELDEVLANDRLLQILGYTTEDFASTVVNEGLPTYQLPCFSLTDKLVCLLSIWRMMLILSKTQAIITLNKR